MCLDTYPAIHYLNSHSHAVIRMCNQLNSESIKVAYSFDAGFHAFLFVLQHNKELVMSKLKEMDNNGQVFERIIETRIGEHGSQQILQASYISETWLLI